MKRLWTIAVLVVVLLLVSSMVAVRSYLRSHRVSQQVATQLEELYGGHVRVGEVEVGLNSTSISDFGLYEHGGSATTGDPWLKIATLTVDVSLWDLVNSKARPTQVSLKGATLLLRFDRAGNLLTRFPSPATSSWTAGAEPRAIPAMEIEASEVIFRKEGHPDITIQAVHATLTDLEGRLVLAGSGDNAELGKLLLSGTREKGSTVANFQLKTEKKAHLTQSILDRMPFVPADVWEEIQIANAETTAQLNLSYDLSRRSLRYRVRLAPENAALRAPGVGLSAHGVSGMVTIEDSLVKLREIKGQAFGGQFQTQADLDFRGDISHLTFSKINVEGLNIHELPTGWNIPVPNRKAIVMGTWTAQATLSMSIRAARVTPESVCTLVGMPSQWFSATAMVAVFPQHEVQIQSQGKGQVRDPAHPSEPIEFNWQFAR